MQVRLQVHEVKSLEVFIPVLKRKKLDNLKISGFSSTHQRTKISGQTANPICQETELSRELT